MLATTRTNKPREIIDGQSVSDKCSIVCAYLTSRDLPQVAHQNVGYNYWLRMYLEGILSTASYKFVKDW